MSHLTYFSYAATYHYSQAVRMGDQILLSGQGGLDTQTNEISSDLRTEVDQAFKNVEQHVKEAGGKGIAQVYKLIIYFAPLDDAMLEIAGDVLKKWFPDHAPLVTGIGVEKFVLPGMRIEIEAWAHVSK